MRRIVIFGCLVATLAACGPSREEIKAELRREAMEERTVTIVKTEQAPCPGTVPKRPAPIGALPTTYEALAAALGAKLKEYAGPGMYADKAEEYFRACPPKAP